ncbi:hypothetical protein CONPUDRAFT_101388 [Coniophora puteana RWD-64-598 SS2]|uniref:GLTSCR protein conserved domain-containing protein n=1 Tax=Coniophora puteana (strain RWD-64-598) TaxID=741705 RepID=A0A5M3MV82_CONPW|nr:uncharacterized protein CONPUDRAFT_101388 [Coniophora puteana RWD-64-598 SS2]EIW82917.1 hypothetical protein CONPUDRAFT_101388 [Coniophora puteana RWD-64-598 SS2]
MALYPDIDSPFEDAFDVVERLLPYHVFQQPEDDLQVLIGKGKGKERATSSDTTEIAETKFALGCHRRLRKLQERFEHAKVTSGNYTSSGDQAYFLAQAVLETERADNAALSSELRNARTELDMKQREKRLAQQQTFRPSFYPQPSQAQYYRSYPYAYTQPYAAAAPLYTTMSAVPPTPTASSPTSATTSTLGTPLHTAPPTPVSYAQTHVTRTAIPVQLPANSLSALHALGIVPVPAANLPPPDQPQPPAVLKETTQNGTMLSLEINISLLQSAQMSGLAILLNSIMSRSSQAQTAPANTAGAAVTPTPVRSSQPSTPISASPPGPSTGVGNYYQNGFGGQSHPQGTN